jgi:hydrogenase maturation protease
MRRVVLAGYGNTLRRDDGVGWYVVAALAERWATQVTVLLGQHPLPEWAETLGGSDVAFIVDASLTAGDRLRLQCVVPAAGATVLDGHCLQPEQLLRLAAELYGHAPMTYLLTIPAVDLAFGEGLSPKAARAADRARRLLDRRLASLV